MSNLDPRPDAVRLRAGVVRAVDVVEARKAVGTLAHLPAGTPSITLSAAAPARFYRRRGPARRKTRDVAALRRTLA